MDKMSAYKATQYIYIFITEKYHYTSQLPHTAALQHANKIILHIPFQPAYSHRLTCLLSYANILLKQDKYKCVCIL